MFLLTHIRHPRHAQAFVDYLQTLGIVAQAQTESSGTAVLLHDPAQLPRAREELARFLTKPEDARYWQASWLVEDEQAASTLAGIYRGPSLLAFVQWPGWVTGSLMLVCVLAYVLTGEGKDVPAREVLMFYPSVDALLDGSQLWRWISPAFLHFGIYHIAFNLIGWWGFGGLVERTQSSMRLLGLFLVLALISNGAQFWWAGNQFGGLSGVVYGLLGYLWCYERVNPAAPFQLPKGVVVLMWVMAVLSFLPVLPFASWAHLGGLLGGCVLGAGLALLDRPRPDDDQKLPH